MIYIEEWEGLYSITKDGEVFSHLKNRFKSKTLNKYNGYEYVTLKKKGRKTETKSIHRLVALAYVENPNGKKEVDHIDCDKTNNNYSNLQWASRSEQVQYQYNRGNRLNYLSKVSKAVVNKSTGEEFNSLISLSKHLNINYSTVKWRTVNNKWDWELVREKK